VVAPTSDATVLYQGAVVDLDKVMVKLEKSESARLAAEEEIRTLTTQLGKVLRRFAHSLHN